MVIPGALIGFAGLADGIGPRGWLGFAELLGWGMICWAVAIAIGMLLRPIREGGFHRYLAVLLTAAAVAALTWVPYWTGLYAPMAAKIAFTTTVQIVGSLTPIALIGAALFKGARQRY